MSYDKEKDEFLVLFLWIYCDFNINCFLLGVKYWWLD